MNSVAEVVEKIEQSAVTPNRTVRDVRGKMKIGQVVRQGDLYFLRINGQKLNKKAARADQNRNLAAGGPETSSAHHHTAVGDVTLFDALPVESLGQGEGGKDPLNRDSLLGPVVRANSEWSVEHPEHTTVVMEKGCYQVIYQLDPRTSSRSAD